MTNNHLTYSEFKIILESIINDGKALKNRLETEPKFQGVAGVPQAIEHLDNVIAAATGQTQDQAGQPDRDVSMAVPVADENGFEMTITVSADNMAQLLDKWPAMANYLVKRGFVPAKAAAPVQSASAAANGGDDIRTIPASSMRIGVSKNGKTHWRVLGGRYWEYGIPLYKDSPAYEDAIRDKVIPAQLDPDEEHRLDGITAHFIMGDNEQPYKVVKLEKTNG